MYLPCNLQKHLKLTYPLLLRGPPQGVWGSECRMWGARRAGRCSPATSRGALVGGCPRCRLGGSAAAVPGVIRPDLLPSLSL